MTRKPTGRMERTPGPHVTRRLTEPRGYSTPQRPPGPTAHALAQAHNEAVRNYGSDCGGYHAFQPSTSVSDGVWTGEGGYPSGSVVTALAWGRIDTRTAQRVLEADGVFEDDPGLT